MNHRIVGVSQFCRMLILRDGNAFVALLLLRNEYWFSLCLAGRVVAESRTLSAQSGRSCPKPHLKSPKIKI